MENKDSRELEEIGPDQPAVKLVRIDGDLRRNVRLGRIGGLDHPDMPV
jgi:hypothetical protein